MNIPKISVIVPVCNVEQYLPRCIDSILAQTFKNFELLLVDDGSQDSSGRICDEYATKDNRIRVFHKENGGVSSARNLGLDNARGEWLAFIDADDWISPDFLDITDSNNAEVIEKGYTVYNEKGQITKKYPVSSKYFKSQEDYFHLYVNKRNNALWNKIIRRDVTTGCLFDTYVEMGEDFLFYLSFIGRVKKYSYSRKGTYCYFMRSTSATRNFDRNIQSRINVLWKNSSSVAEILKDSKYEYLREGIIYRTYMLRLYNLINYLGDDEKERLKAMFRKMSFRKIKYVDNITKIKLYKAKIMLSVL